MSDALQLPRSCLITHQGQRLRPRGQAEFVEAAEGAEGAQ